MLNTLVLKLINNSRANSLLFKIRQFVNHKILRSIYFAIFESNLNYWFLVWAQNYNNIVLSFNRKKHLELQNFNLIILITVLSPLQLLFFPSNTDRYNTSWFSNEKLQKY